MSATIIWIEDDIDMIDAVVRPLEKDGHHIIRLRTIKAALDAVEQIRQADLILLDIFLPVGTMSPEQSGAFGKRYPGIEILRNLREEKGVQTPVVAFTVLKSEVVDAELKSLGNVRGTVRKPVARMT